MLKRVYIVLAVLLGLVIFLGIVKGFSNLTTFAPLLPPIIAIALAFITHEVVVSLFLGIFFGTIMTYPLDGFLSVLTASGKGLFKSVDTYIVKSIADPDHVSVILFTVLIGGVVGLVAKSGGLQGIVYRLSGFAKNSVLSQFYTWLMGIFIFFDDYANSLIVGNTMRPITDKYRVSREKLSFIVDATAAPVSSLVIVSTWIGYEIGLIQDVFKTTQIDADPYMAFIYSVPCRFYVILMLLFIPICIFLRRDFSSMYLAEKRARKTGNTLRPGSIPISGEEDIEITLREGIRPKAINAFIPIGILVFGVLIGLYITGYYSILESSGVTAAQEANLRQILGSANSFKSLIWASFLATVVAIIMITAQGIMTFPETMRSWLKGLKSMGTAVIILIMAWSLGAVLKDIKTAECVTRLVGEVLSVNYLPLVIFLVSSVIAFATGTSWGSMAIIFPIAVPLAQQLSVGLPEHEMMFAIQASIGAILSGTVFGDHCSPISDTTIMSSIASSMDHMDHVSTQLPYALMVGVIACLVGYLPVGYGLNPWISIILGLVLMVGFILIFGKQVENVEDSVSERDVIEDEELIDGDFSSCSEAME